MAVYTKRGERLTEESAHLDTGCYFADRVIKIRAVLENTRKEQVYWVKDLLADDGKPEIEAFITTLKRR